LWQGYLEMPSTMKKLGVIQFFSWFAFFTMWSLATPALTEHVYNAPKPDAKLYAQVDAENKVLFNKEGQVAFVDIQHKNEYQEMDKAYNTAADSTGSAMGIYGLSSMAFALLLTFYTSKRKINRKYIHMFSLFAGGIGFLFTFFATPATLYISFVLIGISWGSILSMPYAMLSSAVNPHKMGLMMGLFNMFIVIPQIIAALGGINLLYKLIGKEHINAMILAGICLILAGFCNFLITDEKAISD
jgi:maltose/moltooligosaccharide transporter